MCVRYTLHKNDAALAAIAQALARKLAPPEWAQPKYNITLTSVVPVVAIGNDGPEVREMMWGFVAPFDREKEDMPMWPNATREKAFVSRMWSPAVQRKRCLVPANGFYEWETVGKDKYPHLFTLKDEEPFAFAGIWSSATAKMPENFAILTTVPNALVKSYHDRMPVILTHELMAQWIGEKPISEEEYSELTKPFPSDRMDEREVNRFVNSTRNQGPECHGPPEARNGIPAKPPKKSPPKAPDSQLGFGF